MVVVVGGGRRRWGGCGGRRWCVVVVLVGNVWVYGGVNLDEIMCLGDETVTKKSEMKYLPKCIHLCFGVTCSTLARTKW